MRIDVGFPNPWPAFVWIRFSTGARVNAGADEEASVRATLDCQSLRGRVPLRDEVLGARDEIVEHVWLVVEHPRLVPRLAVLPAPAEVRDREEAAELEPQEAARLEARGEGDVEPP